MLDGMVVSLDKEDLRMLNLQVFGVNLLLTTKARVELCSES